VSEETSVKRNLRHELVLFVTMWALLAVGWSWITGFDVFFVAAIIFVIRETVFFLMNDSASIYYHYRKFF